MHIGQIMEACLYALLEAAHILSKAIAKTSKQWNLPPDQNCEIMQHSFWKITWVRSGSLSACSLMELFHLHQCALWPTSLHTPKYPQHLTHTRARHTSPPPANTLTHTLLHKHTYLFQPVGQTRMHKRHRRRWRRSAGTSEHLDYCHQAKSRQSHPHPAMCAVIEHLG